MQTLIWLVGEPEGALGGIRQLIGDVVVDLYASGEHVPEPLASKKYSGYFLVRVPSELHRQLALEAAESVV